MLGSSGCRQCQSSLCCRTVQWDFVHVQAVCKIQHCTLYRCTFCASLVPGCKMVHQYCSCQAGAEEFCMWAARIPSMYHLCWLVFHTFDFQVEQTNKTEQLPL